MADGWLDVQFSLKSAHDALVARLMPVNAGFTVALNGIGTGFVDLDLDDVLVQEHMADLLDGNVIGFYIDGVRQMRMVVDDYKRISVGSSENSGRGLRLIGTDYGGELPNGVVLPGAYPVPGVRRSWTNATHGDVVKTLFDEAATRGAMGNLTIGFTATHDSDAAAWTDLQSSEIKVGSYLDQVFTNEFAPLNVDWAVDGAGILQVRKNWGSDVSGVVKFRPVSSITELERAASSRRLKNVAYVTGSDGVTETNDAASVAARGRREQWVDGQDFDAADRATLASAVVSLSKDLVDSVTLGVDPWSPQGRLFTDYGLGDWISYDDIDEVDTLGATVRIMAISVAFDDDGVTAELTLNTLAESRLEMLGRIQGGIRSSSGSSFGGNPDVPAGDVADQIVAGEDPAGTTPPGTLVLTSGANFNTIWVQADWTGPTADEGVREFEVEWERDASGIPHVTRTNLNSIRIEPAKPGSSYVVKVTNILLSGARGTFASDTIVAAADAIAPGQVVGLSMGNGLRSVTASWSENTEEDMKFGLGQYQVQLDDANTFATPVHDRIVGGLVTSFTDLLANTAYWLRVRAVDTSGNLGLWSATVTVTTGLVADTDMGPDSVNTINIVSAAVTELKVGTAAITETKIGTAAITEAKIHTLAVTEAKIGALAVTGAKIKKATITDAEIGSLNADKIIAGTVTGRTIQTSSSGTRVVIQNDDQLLFYNSLNQISMSLLGDTGAGGAILGFSPGTTAPSYIASNHNLYISVAYSADVLSLRAGNTSDIITAVLRPVTGGHNLEIKGDFTTASNWTTASLMINEDSGRTTSFASLSFHSSGYAKAAILRLSSAAADRLVVRSWDDVNWGTLQAIILDMSTGTMKTDVVPLGPVGRAELKAIDPKTYLLNGHPGTGFVVEEFAAIIPEAVVCDIPDSTNKYPVDAYLPPPTPDVYAPSGFANNAAVAVLWRIVENLDNEYVDRLERLEAKVAGLRRRKPVSVYHPGVLRHSSDASDAVDPRESYPGELREIEAQKEADLVASVAATKIANAAKRHRLFLKDQGGSP